MTTFRLGIQTLAFAATASLLTTACNNSTDAVPVSSVAILQDTAFIPVGGTRQLTAEARSETGAVLTGRRVTWTSLDTTRARVSTTGLVSGVRPGRTRIVAQIGALSDTCEVSPIFEDGFATNTLADYTEHDLSDTRGVWSISGGALTGTGIANHSVLLRNSSEIADGFVEARINRSDDAGLVFRFQSPGRYYLLAVRDDQASLPDFWTENVALYRANNGNFPLLFVRDVALPRRPFTARAEFVGSTIRIFIDGVLVGVVNDAQYTTGGVGVRHMLHPRVSASTNVFDHFRAGGL